MEVESFIEVKGIGVKYRSRGEVVIALNNVSLRVDKSELFCVLGPNGSGKTTLLKAIAGLVKHDGVVLIDGVNALRMPKKALAKIISYSSDISVPEMLSLTVEEAVLTSRYPVSKSFLESSEDIYKVREVMEVLGVLNLRNRKLNELSAGELKKVLLAMALAKDPKILLLDEPDAHMDIRSRVELSKTLRTLKDKVLTIFTTHDVAFAANTATKVLVLNNGVGVALGNVKEVLTEEVLSKVYGVEFRVLNDGEIAVPIPVY
ncbi:MAG: ABC transporter ATP-binding protein [Sulfolobales archaeon]|nr:ABC transporter ATP-binding protein [Sulfolobales archaeon]MCX8198979.1 ABC transporter ATP-binding protein [Sulfolobales archaeon]MDW8169958.1 ABC transporter ATP-binding protein [Desulfurococcaceae archaeon]